jgi:hypothetical protein
LFGQHFQSLKDDNIKTQDQEPSAFRIMFLKQTGQGTKGNTTFVSESFKMEETSIKPRLCAPGTQFPFLEPVNKSTPNPPPKRALIELAQSLQS